MRILRIEAMKFAAGSWDDVGPALKKVREASKESSFPKVKYYASVSGGETMHTLYLFSEWESLAVMEQSASEATENKGLMTAIEELAKVVDSSEVTLLKQIAEKDLGI